MKVRLSTLPRSSNCVLSSLNNELINIGAKGRERAKEKKLTMSVGQQVELIYAQTTKTNIRTWNEHEKIEKQKK